MENKSPRYLSLVIQQGRHDAKEYFWRDKKSVVGRIVIGVSGAGVSAIIAVLRTGIGGIMDIITTAIIALIGGAVALVVWYLALFIYSVVVAPAKLYRDKEGEIARLRRQLEVLESPFDITPLIANTNFSQSDTRWVTIRVYNKSSTDEIKECFMKLTNIFEMDKGVNRKIDPQKLTWSGREHNQNQSGNQTITVHCNDERWCDLAMTMPKEAQDTATFTVWFGTGSQPMKIRIGKYRLTIEAHGVWQNRSIVYPYSVVLNFESKYKLMVESVEEIVKPSAQPIKPTPEGVPL